MCLRGGACVVEMSQLKITPIVLLFQKASIYIYIPSLRLGVAIIYTSQSIKSLLQAVDSPMKPHYGVSSSPTIPCKELNLFTSCPNESALSSSALDLYIRATPCTRILMSKIVKNDVIGVLPIIGSLWMSKEYLLVLHQCEQC